MAKDEKMRFYLSMGLDTVEIAKRLSVHRVTISRWKNDIKKQYLELEKGAGLLFS